MVGIFIRTEESRKIVIKEDFGFSIVDSVSGPFYETNFIFELIVEKIFEKLK